MYWVGVGLVASVIVTLAAMTVNETGWINTLILFGSVFILGCLLFGGLFLMAKYG